MMISQIENDNPKSNSAQLPSEVSSDWQPQPKDCPEIAIKVICSHPEITGIFGEVVAKRKHAGKTDILVSADKDEIEEWLDIENAVDCEIIEGDVHDEEYLNDPVISDLVKSIERRLVISTAEDLLKHRSKQTDSAILNWIDLDGELDQLKQNRSIIGHCYSYVGDREVVLIYVQEDDRDIAQIWEMGFYQTPEHNRDVLLSRVDGRTLTFFEFLVNRQLYANVEEARQHYIKKFRKGLRDLRANPDSLFSMQA